MFGADYLGKAAWYARSGDSSGKVDDVNNTRRKMFESLPYVGAGSHKPGVDETGKGSSVGERLMWRLIERERAMREAGITEDPDDDDGDEEDDSE